MGASLLLLTTALAVGGPPIVQDVRSSTVGLPARIEGLVLPGPELEVKPLADRRSPVVVRIVRTSPHGTAFRYDLEYHGLEPGKYDLKEYLRRKDGSSAADLPAIAVEIVSVLPPGQVQPNELEPKPPPRLGGYQLTLLVAGVFWVLGLLVILFVGRRKRVAEEQAAARPRTLADHLRPLVEGALAGRLAPTQLAELERTLLIYWERRLHLGTRKPAEAIAELRRHPEAGPLLRQLEAWLHRPGPAAGVDVAALLKPYQDIPADALAEEAQAC
jgi:hypothetical protein